MYQKYYSCGSRSEAEGLTLVTQTYYDDGTLAAGVEDISLLYKPKELTRAEFEAIGLEGRQEGVKFGVSGGIVNEEGYKKAQELIAKSRQDTLDSMQPRIQLVVKKIKKLLQLGVLEEQDIDVQIELDNMVEFREEIKKQLAL